MSPASTKGKGLKQLQQFPELTILALILHRLSATIQHWLLPMNTQAMIWVQVKNRAGLKILTALLAVAVAAVVRIVFMEALGLHNPFLIFYPAVMIAALCGGFLPGRLAPVLSALIPPSPDKGTGIGLFMSKAITEKNMVWRLTVRNTPAPQSRAGGKHV